MTRIRHLVFALPLLLLGCPPPVPPYVPETVEACEAAGVVLDFYSCEEGPGRFGADYLPNCKHMASLGYVWTTPDSGPVCIRKAQSLEQLRACHVECKQ